MEDVLELMKQDLDLAGYSAHTKRAYLASVKRLVQPGGVSALTPRRLRAWAREKAGSGVGADRVRQEFAAVRFLFRKTLGRPEAVSFLSVRASRGRVPCVLSRDEVRRLIDVVRSPVLRMLFITMHGTGLRLAEACALEWKDIDADRGLIHVRQAKRGGERMVAAGPRLMVALQEYRSVTQWSRRWLFGTRHDRPLHPDVVRRALTRCAAEASIAKRVTPHALRHTFATHLLEAGVDLRVIQWLLGHRSIRSTARYAHVSSSFVERIGPVLDALPLVR